MAQYEGGVVTADVRIGPADRLLRAVVVAVLGVEYVAWLVRRPISAGLCAAVVLVLVCAWYRAPWAVDGRRVAAPTGALRTAGLGEVDLMTCREFQQLVARLMRRDDVAEVRVTGLRDDLSTDVVGRTPAGYRLAVQCSRDAPRCRVRPAEVERFVGIALDEHGADIAVLVTTGRFTRSALALGRRSDLVLLDRRHVAAWMTGRATPLTPYLAAI